MTAKKTSPGDSGELISAYLDGELAADERTQVEELLATDSEALKLLEDLKKVSQTIRALPRRSLGPSLRGQVLDATVRPTTPPRAEGFRRGLAWASLAAAAALLLTITQRGNFYGDATSDESVAQVPPSERMRKRAPLSAGPTIGAAGPTIGAAGPTIGAAGPTIGAADATDKVPGPVQIAQGSAEYAAKSESRALVEGDAGNAHETTNGDSAVAENGAILPPATASEADSLLRDAAAAGAKPDSPPSGYDANEVGGASQLERVSETSALAVRVVLDAEAREGQLLDKLFRAHAIRQIDKPAHPHEPMEAYFVTAPQANVERLLADLGGRMAECREVAVDSVSSAPPPSSGGSWQRFNVSRQRENGPLRVENENRRALALAELDSESRSLDEQRADVVEDRLSAKSSLLEESPADASPADASPADASPAAESKAAESPADSVAASSAREREPNWGFAYRMPVTGAHFGRSRQQLALSERQEDKRATKSAAAAPGNIEALEGEFLSFSLLVEWRSTANESASTSTPAGATPPASALPAPAPENEASSATSPP